MAAGFFFILVTAAHFPSYLVSFTDIAVRHEQNLPASSAISSGVGFKTTFGSLHKYKRVLSEYIITFSSFVHLSSQLNKVSTVAIQKLEPLRGTYRGPVGHGIA